MLATTSVEAIVNARIETIRAPIEGIVQAPAEKTANWSSTAAPPKLTISNPYADRSRLDELRRDLNTPSLRGLNPPFPQLGAGAHGLHVR
jgi:hypothetical protein